MTDLNPLTILDQILGDWASPKVRRLVHSLIALIVALVAIYLAVDGDWVAFVIALGGTLYAVANKANTPATELTPAGVDDPHGADLDESVSYEEAGGNDFPSDPEVTDAI